MPQSQSTQDSGYYGSQDIDAAPPVYSDLESSPQKLATFHVPNSPTKQSPSHASIANLSSKTLQTAKGEQTRQLAQQAVFSDTESSPIRHNLPKHAQSSSPLKQSPLKSPILHSDSTDVPDENDQPDSPSEASSPIRQVVRKSSLNFASLPAREPLAAGKNPGRVSRVSHLEKPCAGKSLGHVPKDDASEVDDDSDINMDEDEEADKRTADDAASHTRTYTQRLQDQINQLRKSNSGTLGQARSYPNIPSAKQSALPVSQSDPSIVASPTRKQSISKVLQTTPGAFPEEDDDDDWIEPPSAAPPTEARPAFPKSYSADVMEGIQGKDTIGQLEFTVAKPEYATRLQAHGKSASVTTLPSMKADMRGDLPLTKSISVSHELSTVAESQGLETPSGSPSRLFRDSPLKQMKSRLLSSILKSSRSLLASSAAISAEAKSSLLSPSTIRLGMHASPSSASLVSKARIASDASQNTESSLSPAKTRRTRASTEREREDKRREKEAKLMAEQMDRLDKAREKEREKARVFSKEQERIAAMEKEIATKKQEEQMHAKQTPKARSNPRKTRSDDEGEKTDSQDLAMADAPQIVPPSAARTASTTHSLRNRDVKRPVRPTKEDMKAKQVPTVIRVKPGSQHSQFHQADRPSTNPQEHANLASSQQLGVKASKASLHSKASSQSLKSSTNTRPKAAETAAKKKEVEEREAQKRRDVKAEIERKRVASQEEQRRQEQQRRAESERQKKEKESAEERKTAQRQAALEKAKQTKAPPPAARSQPNGPPDFTISQQQKMESQGNRPPSRMMAGPQRQQAEPGKAGIKRPVGQDSNEDAQDRRPPTRAGPAYQGKDAKRRRTSEAFQDEVDGGSQHIKGPPVRPSPGFKKDIPPKSLFQNGYSNAPPSAAHDLFKASIAAQQLQSKAARPVDMAQISKGTIPFAPNANAAGPAFKTPGRPGPYLAAKSAAKSVPRASPQFQNGESIDLPEIDTEDEDEEENDGMGKIAGWAASPDLRVALMRQETMDPSQIFGPPAPLNMEEVFSKSKDRWPKFRARTSSANWSGPDGLTEDDIRKDLAAREKLRHDGGWSYEMSRDVL